MNKRLTSLCFLTALLAGQAAYALPTAIAERMQYMCKTDEPFVRQAIMRELRLQFPQYDGDIVRSWPGICQGKVAVTADEPAAILMEETVVTTPEGVQHEMFLLEEEPIAEDEVSTGIPVLNEALNSNAVPSITGFTGQVEAGVSVQSGNTEAVELNLQASGEQELENWRHHFEAAAFNSKENGIRNDEEYRVGLGTDWKMNARDYLFAELGYVNDRYAGYKYRIHENIGIGRRWVDDGIYLLDTRIGPGMRHTKFTTGDKEDSWTVLGGLRAGWVVNEHVELGEEAEVEYSPDGTIITSDTWAKSKLTEDLSMKAGFNVEHKTEVPAGVDKTDTRTTLGLVYGF